MFRFFKIFILIFGIGSCSPNTDKIVEELNHQYNQKFEVVGNSGSEFFFVANAFYGEPFTDSFSSYSQIMAYEIDGNIYHRTFDTIFYSTNNYSDIKIDITNLQFGEDTLRFPFIQCPDGNDECVTTTLTLPTLNHRKSH